MIVLYTSDCNATFGVVSSSSDYLVPIHLNFNKKINLIDLMWSTYNCLRSIKIEIHAHWLCVDVKEI